MVSNASYALGDLLDESTQRLKSIYKNAIDGSILAVVWGHTCIFIEEQLVKGKAVLIPGLGTFTYIHKKTEIGNKGVKSTITPVFVVADAFRQASDVKKDSFSNLTTSVPTLTLNYSLIASQCETTRDIVMDFFKEATRGIGAAIRNNRSVAVEVKNIGTLVYSGGGTLKGVFNSDLVAQMQISIKNGNSPSMEENIEPLNTITLRGGLNTSLLSPSHTPKLKVNNFLSPVPSRNGTPRDDSPPKSPTGAKSAIILPQVDRPKHPRIKLRANSDSALRPLSAFGEEREKPQTKYEEERDGEDEVEEEEEEERDREDESECEDDTCEHCKLEQTNARAAQLRRAKERAADESAMRAQRGALQALEEKEQLAVRLQKARREDADQHNKTIISQKQENAITQKKKDFYGDIFYARRPDTPEHVKKAGYKSALEEQMLEKIEKSRQKKLDSRKDHAVFHETQKEADERARKLKQEEKQKQKDYADQLMQQISQKPNTPGEIFESFEKSKKPNFEKSGRASEDSHRPSTAELKEKRRSFDSKATDHHREAIQQRKQKEIDDRATLAREQLEIAQRNQELRQQQQQDDINKKMLTREMLRNAWDTQMAHKRQLLAETTQKEKPMRSSLDLGQLAFEKNKSKCKKCGRGFSKFTPNSKNHFYRRSGDFRTATFSASENEYGRILV